MVTVREALVGLMTTLLKAKQAREQVLSWLAAVANHNRQVIMVSSMLSCFKSSSHHVIKLSSSRLHGRENERASKRESERERLRNRQRRQVAAHVLVGAAIPSHSSYVPISIFYVIG